MHIYAEGDTWLITLAGKWKRGIWGVGGFSSISFCARRRGIWVVWQKERAFFKDISIVLGLGGFDQFLNGWLVVIFFYESFMDY